MSLSKPNFLIILADDLGNDDLSLHGNAYCETPNLDALGNDSVRLSQFTVNPVCAPSRATFLTGRHFLRTGVSHVHGGKDFLHRDEVTIADVLKQHGYATGMWGKWHSGNEDGYYPWQRGFDEVYQAQLYRHQNTVGTLPSGEQVSHDRFADEVIADYAIDFIQRHRDQPFFAFLPTMTPHSPHQAPEELISVYEAKGLGRAIATIFAMIHFLDQQLGRVFDCLKDEGLYDDTVILFLSDNGPGYYGDLLTEAEYGMRKVQGLRGWKGDIWEMGVRSPLFLRYGKTFSPTLEDTPTQMPDVFATICDLAGIELADDHLPLDGQTLRPLLEGTEGYQDVPQFNYSNPGWPPSPKYPYTIEGIRNEYQPVTPAEKEQLLLEDQVLSIRQGQQKLLLNPNINYNDQNLPDFFFADLATDPQEQHNALDQHPRQAEQLKQTLNQWFEDIKAEPASFTAPYFALPSARTPSVEIPAKACCELNGGLKNTVNQLLGWNQSDQRATYHLRPNTEALSALHLQLHWVEEPDAATQFSLRIGDQETPIHLQDGTWISIHPLTLPSLSATELTLHVLNPSTHQASLRAIQLTVEPFSE